MIPLAEAQVFVAGLAEPLPARPTALDQVVGTVLAESVVSAERVPPFANSAMDGFAVRAADVAAAPVLLEVVGTVAAGSVATTPLGAGQAYRIMTGAPVPPGADAVVMVEWCETDGDRVRVGRPVGPGTNVRPAGDDIEVGDEVLATGTVVTPAVLGVLCTLGVTTVAAVPRPRVGVCSTGDELVEPGEPLGPGQIRDSNRRTLLALVAEAGAEAVDLGRSPDEPGAIEATFRRAVEECDLVLSSGGVSMGDFDHVKAVLGRIGDVRWMQVAIRPAKPLAAGTLRAVDGRSVPVVGLAGNPVSSMVGFELFARPLIDRLAGRPALDRRRRAAAPDGLSRRPDGKVHLVRVRTEVVDGRLAVHPVAGQGSHHTASMALADALAVLPDGDGVAPGGSVEVLPL